MPDYRTASAEWNVGEPLYQLETIHGFLYFPASAALMSPLLLLPEELHEFGWA